MPRPLAIGAYLASGVAIAKSTAIGRQAWMERKVLRRLNELGDRSCSWMAFDAYVGDRYGRHYVIVKKYGYESVECVNHPDGCEPADLQKAIDGLEDHEIRIPMRPFHRSKPGDTAPADGPEVSVGPVPAPLGVVRPRAYEPPRTGDSAGKVAA